MTLASALVLAAGLALLTLGVNLLLSHRLSADASAVLHERADAQLAALDVKSGRIVLRDAIHNETLDRETWVYAGGRAILRAPGVQDLQRAADALSGVASDTERNVGERFRLRAEPAFVDGARGRRVPLLDNAVRHASRAVTVAISRERADVVFCVQDDGQGIEDASPGSLFEPGVSGAGGAGLGLALARRLARSCGGEVLAIASGDGGRFLLRLPAVG